MKTLVEAVRHDFESASGLTAQPPWGWSVVAQLGGLAIGHLRSPVLRRHLHGRSPSGLYPNCSTVVTVSKPVWLQTPSPTRAHVGCFSPKRAEYHPR